MQRSDANQSSEVNFDTLRAKLRAGGAEFWRSLENLADTAEFRRFVEAEFPSEAPRLLSAPDRRHFLKLMGASIALAGAAGCTRQPEEKLYPYAEQPEQIVAGKPLFYATAMPLSGVSTGLVVESHMGRPTKIEGNKQHPGSLGATDVFAQASILGLYDPDRSSTVRNAGAIRPWSAFVDWIEPRLQELDALGGKGLRILTGRVTSPTLGAQMKGLLEKLPNARWHQYEAISRDQARLASRLAFGREFDTRYHFENADVVLSLDGDFLSEGAGAVRYARDFASRRSADGERPMNRLYVVEPSPTNTGAMADHRLPVGGAEVEEVALAIAAELGLEARAPVGVEDHLPWIRAVARDLSKHQGSCVVVAGERQSAATQLLAHALNEKLGNVGSTVEYTEPVAVEPSLDVGSLQDLSDAMDRGEVRMLVILGANPVFDAPFDLEFEERMKRVPTRVHLGLHLDETAVLCQWHIPEAHFLEAWGDGRAFDGTASISQPLIAPLYDGKSALEMVALLGGNLEPNGYEILRDYWRQHLPQPFEDAWRRAIHDGVVAGTAFPPAVPNWSATLASVLPPRAADAAGIEVVFRSDPSVYDGRFANSGWLQELPRPLTRLTWENAIWVSPLDAEDLGVSSGDVLRVELEGRSVELPAWIVPGQAQGVVTLHLGYGRRRGGYVQDGTGVDVYPIRSSEGMWHAGGASLTRTGAVATLACTQDHHSMEGRDLVRVANVGDGHAHAGGHADDSHAEEEGGHGGGHPDTSLFPDVEYDGYAWGMTIDLNSCTGCNACVIACQSENNIPVVGKDQVAAGREMHWIRVDRYFSGDLDTPEIHHQPVPCMHCERAPCELVCPVNATVHSDEGLNDMVYNRCVGTRYCSNNCPYKVRRFNFFLYNDEEADIVKMAANPDVTIRSRGVMEKCTYCVQRISRTRIEAKKDGRRIRDGEIVTACQSVCPTEAIRFGDVNDPASQVSLAKASARNYSLLHELGTKPRTTYLSAVRNPNPEIEGV